MLPKNSYSEPRKLGLMRVNIQYTNPQTIREAIVFERLKKVFVGIGEKDWIVSTDKTTVTYLCESKYFDIVNPGETIPDYIVFFHDDIEGTPFLTHVKKSEQV